MRLLPFLAAFAPLAPAFSMVPHRDRGRTRDTREVPVDGNPPKRYHRRRDDPEYDPHAPPDVARLGRPHARATDVSLLAKAKEWAAVVAAAGVLCAAGIKVLEWAGVEIGRGPGTRYARLEQRVSRVERDTRALVVYRCTDLTNGKLPPIVVQRCAELEIELQVPLTPRPTPNP